MASFRTRIILSRRRAATGPCTGRRTALPPSFHHGNRPLARPVAWALAQRESGKAVVTEQGAFAVDEREAREAMALSCGMIAMIDDAIGRIWQLTACGLADDTIVISPPTMAIFGDHRLLLKGPAHYGGSRTCRSSGPSPARDRAHHRCPGRYARYRGHILDRAPIQPYNGMQGESLLPVLAGAGSRRDSMARDSMVIEDEQQRAILGHRVPPRMRTLVTRRWRLTISHGDDWGELYDLANDPHEMDNLFEDPGHGAIRGELMEKLAYRQMELTDRSPLPRGRA